MTVVTRGVRARRISVKLGTSGLASASVEIGLTDLAGQPDSATRIGAAGVWVKTNVRSATIEFEERVLRALADCDYPMQQSCRTY